MEESKSHMKGQDVLVHSKTSHHTYDVLVFSIYFHSCLVGNFKGWKKFKARGSYIPYLFCPSHGSVLKVTAERQRQLAPILSFAINVVLLSSPISDWLMINGFLEG